MSEHSFTDHTAHSAPDGSRRLMEAVTRRLGYLPAGVARMAASPQLLEGFLKASALFEASSLEPLAQEVVIMVMAARNGCHVCVAMHTAKLRKLGADEELIDALRRQRPLDDPRLEAVRAFTLEALATAGAVPDEALDAFLAQGWTESNALDVVLGIGTYTLSTFANRLVRAPLDGPLAAFA
ncbi:carboxymuconolactone decarboxylase family protein [Peterkaempfera griseoplana]|uniref:carboxymuconolactone decarboxylase family protein n=1 Tax=Peterkaempfera griseoplana TaxID=66896 RepID=UPI0006E244E1|nr:carboxymuconolactone decarboxylase family protein [Peterkaempfera griseoplana]